MRSDVSMVGRNVAAGDNITCTAVITNTGQDWLGEIDLAGQVNCSHLLLLPGTSITCSVKSAITQADLDNFDAYGISKPITAHALAYGLSNTSQLIDDVETISLPLLVYTGLHLTCDVRPTLVSKAGMKNHVLCLMQIDAQIDITAVA